MVTKIRNYLEKEGIQCEGDGIVVGVSGGADSVCLLCLLAGLRQEWRLRLYAVHVHHGIRGEEADRDAAFTKELCGRLGVACEIVYRDVRGLARLEKCSEEEMGRQLRYEALEEARVRLDCRWIAVAHHREDNAETVIWNLCRGSGLVGLTGIRPARGHILRPLLCCSRAEIEEWLAARGQGFCTDRTNLEESYTRNRLRCRVLPLLEEANAQAVRHITETAERLACLQEYLEEQIRQVLVRVKDEADGLSWEKAEYEACPEGLRGEAVLELLKRAGGQARDFSAEHVRAVRELYGKEVGKQIYLPYGVVAKRTYTGVRFEQKKRPDPEEKLEQKKYYELQLDSGQNQEETGEKTIWLPDLQSTLWYTLWDCTEGGKRAIVSVDREKICFSDGKIIKFPESSCTKWFDYDRIQDRVAVRTRRPGDSLVIHPDGRRKKLKDYWIDQKLPKEEREGKWLLAADSEILWIFGDRTGEGSRIGTDTRRILIVGLTGGCEERPESPGGEAT